ncbi:hypothetical protein [Streptomyces sp. NPDC000229]|uniref:hypothetical protein n=1 Tax=Streptomyces sp. NPDC000229 TaxID=3154247 RepID=UPI0033331218
MSRDRKPRDGDAAAGDTVVPAAVPAALLAAVVRNAEVDPAGEERAVAAFRAARDEGRHAVGKTRRRDDWRPGREQRRRRSLRAAAMGLAATVLLGGVAVAAQTGAIPSPFGGGDGGAVPEPRPSTTSTPEGGVPATPLAERPRAEQGPISRPTRSARTSGAGTGEENGAEGVDGRSDGKSGPKPKGKAGSHSGANAGGRAGAKDGQQPDTKAGRKPNAKAGTESAGKPDTPPEAKPATKGGSKDRSKGGPKGGSQGGSSKVSGGSKGGPKTAAEPGGGKPAAKGDGKPAAKGGSSKVSGGSKNGPKAAAEPGGKATGAEPQKAGAHSRPGGPAKNDPNGKP